MSSKRNPHLLAFILVIGYVAATELCETDVYIEVPTDVQLSSVSLNNGDNNIYLKDFPRSLLESPVSCSVGGTLCPSCCVSDPYNLGECTSTGCQPLRCDCTEEGCLNLCPNQYECVNKTCVAYNRPCGYQCSDNNQCLNRKCKNSNCSCAPCDEVACPLGTFHLTEDSPDMGDCCTEPELCPTTTDPLQTHICACMNAVCVKPLYNMSPMPSTDICEMMGSTSNIWCGTRIPKNCSSTNPCVDLINYYCDREHNLCLHKSQESQPCSSDISCFSGNCTNNVCQFAGSAQLISGMTCTTSTGENDSNETNCLNNPNFFCSNGGCIPKYGESTPCTNDVQCISGVCSTHTYVCARESCVDENALIQLLSGSLINASQVVVGDDLYGFNGERNTVVFVFKSKLVKRMMVGMNGGEKFFTPAHQFVNPSVNPIGSHVYSAESADAIVRGLLPPFVGMVPGKSKVSVLNKGEFESSLIQSFEVEERVVSVVHFVTISESHIHSYVANGIVSGDDLKVSMPTLYVFISMMYDLNEALKNLVSLGILPMDRLKNLSIPATQFISKISEQMREESKKKGLLNEKNFEVEWREVLRELSKKQGDNKLDYEMLSDLGYFLAPNMYAFSWMDQMDPKDAIKLKLKDEIQKKLTMHFLNA